MKIGHIADVHLGYKQSNAPVKDGMNERELDGYRAFETVIKELDKKVDIIIIAGDLFHTPTPSNYCINKAQKILSITKKPIYIISGNHDTNDIKNEYSAVKTIGLKNVKTYQKPYVIKKLNEEITLHLLSHHIFTTEEINKIKKQNNKFNIMVAHGTVSDTFVTNNSPREIFLPNKLLDIFDINLLGHFHTRCKVNKNTYYAGSLLRRGFADEKGKRGYSIYNTKTKKYKTYNIWQRPQVDIIASSQSALEKQLKDVPKNAIVRSNIDLIKNDFFSYDVKKEMSEKEKDSVKRKIKHLNLLVFAKEFLRQKLNKVNKNVLGKIYKEIYNKM